MTVNSNLTSSLTVLDSKLQTLQAMVEANQFLIDSLHEFEDVLKSMDGEDSRAMLRDNAQAVFGAGEGHVGRADVLVILEAILAPRRSAQILEFPVRQ